MSWTREQRRRAKAEQKPLFSIAIDTRTSDPNGKWVRYDGPCSQAEVDEIYELLKRMLTAADDEVRRD